MGNEVQQSLLKYIGSSVFTFLTLSFFPQHWWAFNCTSFPLDLTTSACLLISCAHVSRLKFFVFLVRTLPVLTPVCYLGFVYLSKFCTEFLCWY